ncbi:DUF7519 family protein [Halocatena salina]|uniref:Uncharacterized protein n=1 Tax=Halocatena salina TaxID=2934340 RepID=A0A8U0A5G1_9EURY|nr:hypothetical protein [Halocatena salina]UPM44425.1 hypothetical protein MW046_13335 [Halocatena salina]
MSAVDRSPARLSSALGLAFGTTVLFLLGSSGLSLAVGPGLFGMGVLVVGLRRQSRLFLTLGVSGLLVGVVVIGLLGARPVPLLIATVATVLTWDVTENAITVGERLGRDAETWPVEIVHVATTAVVSFFSAGAAILVFHLSIDGAPAAAVIVLLLAGVFLALGLRT